MRGESLASAARADLVEAMGKGRGRAVDAENTARATSADISHQARQRRADLSTMLADLASARDARLAADAALTAAKSVLAQLEKQGGAGAKAKVEKDILGQKAQVSPGESGPDCLICAEFARQRYPCARATPETAIPESQTPNEGGGGAGADPRAARQVARVRRRGSLLSIWRAARITSLLSHTHAWIHPRPEP